MEIERWYLTWDVIFASSNAIFAKSFLFIIMAQFSLASASKFPIRYVYFIKGYNTTNVFGVIRGSFLYEKNSHLERILINNKERHGTYRLTKSFFLNWKNDWN